MTRPGILLRLLREDGPTQEGELRAICGWSAAEFSAVAESLRQSGLVVASSEQPSSARIWALGGAPCAGGAL